MNKSTSMFVSGILVWHCTELDWGTYVPRSQSDLTSVKYNTGVKGGFR